MTKDEFLALRPGDLVRDRSGEVWVVHAPMGPGDLAAVLVKVKFAAQWVQWDRADVTRP